MKLKVSEIYGSVQGEGPNTGIPTTFVRFGGCNMRCPGWPCDTQHAIDPKFQGEWERSNYLEVLKKIPKYPTNVCFTGGEPFMQSGGELRALADALYDRGHTLEAFSNGSFPYEEWVKAYGVRIMMDWKLPGSGEADTNIEMRRQNYMRLTLRDGVKFVVTGQEDLDCAFETYHDLPKNVLSPRFWVGAAWGRITDAEIIDYIMQYKLPWSLNVQVHKHIWDPDKRGV